MQSMASKNMNAKAKKARSEYLKQWRKNNPDKVKQHAINYWLKKAQEMEATGNG